MYPASQPVEGELPFTDKEEILDWMKGYVNESVKAGVLKGYPDGSFQPNKTSTRAEAVVMIQRMLEEMEEGLMRWILPRRYVCSTENLFSIRMKSVIPFCKKEKRTKFNYK